MLSRKNLRGVEPIHSSSPPPLIWEEVREKSQKLHNQVISEPQGILSVKHHKYETT